MEDSSSVISGIGLVSYLAYISEISANNDMLRRLTLASLAEEITDRGELPVAEFAVLLRALNVPGPCFLVYGSSFIGCGAQFVVRQGEIGFISKPGAGTSIVALKSPKFTLDAEERLDLSTEIAWRQVRDLIVEVAALCHPNLRPHPNIVDIIGWGFDKSWHNPPFLALELADGDLEGLLKSDNPLSFENRRHIISDIASALDAIHEIGLIHGDLKPENILVFKRQSLYIAKLSDFGSSADLTKETVLRGLGTVGWRAPELRRHHEDNEPIHLELLDRMDTYSFGLVAWCILCQSTCPPRGSKQERTGDSALIDLQGQQIIPTTLMPIYEVLLQACLCDEPRNRPVKISKLLEDPKEDMNMNIVSREVESLTLHDDSNDEENASEIPSDGSSDAWHCDMEILDIDAGLSLHLMSAFLDDEKLLSPETAFALFLKWEHFSPEGASDPEITGPWFRLLRAAAFDGILQARSLIFLCYQYHELIPDKDIEVNRRDWQFDSIVTGALTHSETTRSTDPSLFDNAIQKFQEYGGYNQDYSDMTSSTLKDYCDLANGSFRPGVSAEEPLNRCGDRLLHILSSFHHPVAFSLLKTIATSTNVNNLNDEDESPLYRACACGAFETVLFLLDLGADPTLRPYGDGPSCLHWIFTFHPERIGAVTDKLIEKGALTSVLTTHVDRMLHYPFMLPAGGSLHWAVEISCVEAVRALLRHGADPWLSDGVRQLIFATETPEHQPELLDDIVHDEFILGPSAGSNAVELAVQNWDYGILQLLLHNALQPTGESISDGIGIFHRLIAGDFRWISTTSRFYNPMVRGGLDTRRLKIKCTINALLSSNFDINSRAIAWRNGVTSTTLMLAIHTGNIEVAEALLEAGADVNVSDSDGRTALMYIGSKYSALYTDEDETQKLFQVRVTKLLLAHGARTDIRDKHGYSPVLSLAQQGFADAVEVLLENGVAASDRVIDIDSVRDDGDFPIFAMLAQRGGGRNNESREQIYDEKLASMLGEYVVPLLEQTALANSQSASKTLLHHVASARLVESAAVLLYAGVSVNAVYKEIHCDGVTTRQPKTPLDEVLGVRRFVAGEIFSKTEAAKLHRRFDRMVELLRSNGALEAHNL